MLMYTTYAFPFDISDTDELQAKESKFQNVWEFLGVILAMMVCSRLAGGRPCSMHWCNDNSSSLSWVGKNMAKSKAAQLAFLVFTWVGLMSGCRKRIRMARVLNSSSTLIRVPDR